MTVIIPTNRVTLCLSFFPHPLFPPVYPPFTRYDTESHGMLTVFHLVIQLMTRPKWQEWNTGNGDSRVESYAGVRMRRCKGWGCGGRREVRWCTPHSLSLLVTTGGTEVVRESLMVTDTSSTHCLSVLREPLMMTLTNNRFFTVFSHHILVLYVTRLTSHDWWEKIISWKQRLFFPLSIRGASQEAVRRYTTGFTLTHPFLTSGHDKKRVKPLGPERDLTRSTL